MVMQAPSTCLPKANAMHTRPDNDKAFWAHVTIFGTLWGGLELTLGTFLHILHVPKTGLIMTGLTAILLIAQRVIYPHRGATLAAGVIAACIKSLSPGGIILGPVIGILSEALMIEIGLFLSSRCVVTAVLSGILAIFSCQLQSFFKLWIYYGNDFIRALVKIAEKFFNMHWTATLGWTLIGLLTGTLGLIGCLVGITGYLSGRRVVRQLNTEANATSIAASLPQKTASSPWLPTDRRNPQETDAIVSTRQYVFPFVLLTIALQCCTGLLPWLTDLLTLLSSLGVMLIVLALWARPVLRRIWWPKFWGLTIAVSLLAGLILGWRLDGSLDPVKAATASLQMTARGVYVFLLVMWMTRSVRSDEFDAFCARIHLPQLGLALRQAYQILPAWIDRFNALLASRPKGIRHTWHYLKESAVDVLIVAARDAADNARTEEVSDTPVPPKNTSQAQPAP